ncbi:MAG: hypothetical protein J6V71_01685 [Clostridia bacterium]|nr:hypothetical protein [Clostridia bacterium]
MKNSICCDIHKGENTIIVDNIDEISQNISKILPFSKIAVVCFSDEFFELGKELKNALLQKGLKVIYIILADNFSANKEKFDDFLHLPEDVRGIIAFNNKLIPLVFSNYLKDKTAFFIEGCVGCALKQNTYFFRDRDLLKEIAKNERLYIMIRKDKLNLDNYIKCACLYVNMLIDYLFRQNLLQENIDMSFVNKAKSFLIDTLFILKSEKEQRENKVIENLLKISEMIKEKDCYYPCSAVISSFLICDDFFNIDCIFTASKLIIKKYEQVFSRGLNLSIVDYNEVAKALCFITGLNQKQILTAIESLLKNINTDNLLTIKPELKKLILLYNDLSKTLKGKLSPSEKSYKQDLLLSISLSGFTPFGINGMTAFQE